LKKYTMSSIWSFRLKIFSHGLRKEPCKTAILQVIKPFWWFTKWESWYSPSMIEKTSKPTTWWGLPRSKGKWVQISWKSISFSKSARSISTELSILSMNMPNLSSSTKMLMIHTNILQVNWMRSKINVKRCRRTPMSFGCQPRFLRNLFCSALSFR
jgi:hypothetical protein